MFDKLRDYINENLVKEECVFNDICESPKLFGTAKRKASYDFNMKCESCSFNIDDYIKENKDLNKFQTLLFKLIDDRGLTDSDVYNKVHIDRRLFSKIRSDSDYHPSKETVILLGISLELSENELEELLNSASYSLPMNNHYDLIIRFCFINKIYNLITINDFLDSYHCKLFNY